MPFGRYRGALLDQLPDDYLAWLLTLDDLREPLRSAVAREANRRRTHEWRHETSARLACCPAPDVAEALIGAGLRSLSRRYHPDAGGTHEQMIQVTAVADWLRGVLRGRAA
jgi:hypothetical protein